MDKDTATIKEFHPRQCEKCGGKTATFKWRKFTTYWTESGQEFEYSSYPSLRGWGGLGCGGDGRPGWHNPAAGKKEIFSCTCVLCGFWWEEGEVRVGELYPFEIERAKYDERVAIWQVEKDAKNKNVEPVVAPKNVKKFGFWWFE